MTKIHQEYWKISKTQEMCLNPQICRRPSKLQKVVKNCQKCQYYQKFNSEICKKFPKIVRNIIFWEINKIVWKLSNNCSKYYFFGKKMSESCQTIV